MSICFSLGMRHGAFSDHTKNRQSDECSMGFTNLIARPFSLHHPDNTLFICRFNAAPGKAIYLSGPAIELREGENRRNGRSNSIQFAVSGRSKLGLGIPLDSKQ
jgi:hypothetical protein